MELTKYLYQQLQQIPSIRIYGPEPDAATIGRVAIVTFSTEKFSAQHLANHLDQAGIAITAGFHATKPLHEYLGIQATAQASLYFYNTHTEIDRFIAALKRVIH